MKRNNTGKASDASSARKTSVSNKAVSLLLSLAMCPMLVPTAAFAAEDGTQPGASAAQTEQAQQQGAEGAAVQSDDASQAEGSEVNDSGEGEVNTNSAAEANGVKYSSLQSAIEGSEDGTTVKVLGDIELDDTVVVEGKSLTLDLGGHKLYNTNDIWEKVRTAGRSFPFVVMAP